MYKFSTVKLIFHIPCLMNCALEHGRKVTKDTLGDFSLCLQFYFKQGQDIRSSAHQDISTTCRA